MSSSVGVQIADETNWSMERTMTVRTGEEQNFISEVAGPCFPGLFKQSE